MLAMHFSATTDMWSSHGMKPYMGFTVHHIDNDWRLQSHPLGTLFVPESHTGDVLGQAMLGTLSDWKLSSDNQVCLTTNNGTNTVKAASDLEWRCTSCFGHNLHLGITKAFTDEPHVSRSLGVARGIVSKFHYGFQKMDALQAVQMKDKKQLKTLVSVGNFYILDILKIILMWRQSFHKSVSTPPLASAESTSSDVTFNRGQFKL